MKSLGYYVTIALRAIDDEQRNQLRLVVKQPYMLLSKGNLSKYIDDSINLKKECTYWVEVSNIRQGKRTLPNVDILSLPAHPSLKASDFVTLKIMQCQRCKLALVVPYVFSVHDGFNQVLYAAKNHKITIAGSFSSALESLLSVDLVN